MKPHLSPRDKIKAAYYYHIMGLTQHQIAVVLECTNNGRINEAIKAIELTVGLDDIGGYKDKAKEARDAPPAVIAWGPK